MRSAQYIFAAALTFALAGTAAAQTTSAPSSATTQPTYVGSTVSHWLASGFVGGGFSASGDSPNIDSNSAGSVNYGGQIAWLWRGIVGPEFLADWAPNFDVSSSLIDGNTRVANYMFNAIGAYPLGADGQVQPYASGGFGRTRLSADIRTVNGTESHGNGGWGSNVGGGIMFFANKGWGARGDIRYYHARTNDSFSGSPSDQFFESVASGLSYWNASGGISYRW
jgi:Outer membrane protein beta-barrel domain